MEKTLLVDAEFRVMPARLSWTQPTPVWVPSLDVLHASTMPKMRFLLSQRFLGQTLKPACAPRSLAIAVVEPAQTNLRPFSVASPSTADAAVSIAWMTRLIHLPYFHLPVKKPILLLVDVACQNSPAFARQLWALMLRLPVWLRSTMKSTDTCVELVKTRV